jgi:phosphatidate phosphatase PAH1
LIGQLSNGGMTKSDAVMHLMGVVGVIVAMWGVGSLYNAIIDPQHYWLQGLVGIACLTAALLIYRRWFSRR